MNNISSPSLATNIGNASSDNNVGSNSLAKTQTTAEQLLSRPSSLSAPTQYTVQPGDTLGAIAQRNGVSIDALAAHNGITNPNRIFVGDNLSIPQVGTTATAQTYTVQSGDTLNNIANTHGVSVASITSANNISNPNRIYPGDTLTIPQVANTTTAAQNYTIQPGDTLNDIASTHGVSVASISSANNISNPNRIYPGDVITIPGASVGNNGTPGTATAHPVTDPRSPVASGTSPFSVQAVIDAVPAGVRRANPDLETHVNNILEMSAKHGLSADQTAYVLATATHESGLGAYMEEFASGRAYEGRADLGNTERGDGVRFKGRGYVQVTGRANYQDWSNRLGIDLVGNPSLAEQPHIAAEILVVGMKDGSFTGRSLDRYINDGATDFTNARRIVNGTDRADLIAGYATNYQTALATPAPVAPSTPATPTTATTLGAEGSNADIWVKSTADVDSLSAPITATFDDIAAVWQDNNGPTPVITSGNDGRHSHGSLHYSDNAVDLRTNNISDALSQRIADDLQARLGNDYDVIFERFPTNPSNDHIHVEYDPR